MSHRRRVALAAADQFKALHRQDSLSGSVSLNDSGASLISTSSKDEKPHSSTRRVVRAGEKISRQRTRSSGPGVRTEGNGDEQEHDNETVLSSSTSQYRRSRRPGRGEGHGTSTSAKDSIATGSDRGKSRSRSHSRKRSKSAKSRNRRPAPSQSASGSNTNPVPSRSRSHSKDSSSMELTSRPRTNTNSNSNSNSYDYTSLDDSLHDSSSGFIPPISPVGRGGVRHGGGSSGDEDDDDRCDTEQEILDFLVSPGNNTPSTNSQRLCRSMDNLDFNMDNNTNNNSGRASRSIGGSRSMRRERTTGTSTTGTSNKTRSSSSRDASSSYPKRPPRSSRGVGRSKSDMEGMLLSPIKSPRKSPDVADADEFRNSRSPPGRSKSDGVPSGDLGDFFSRTNTSLISRRKKPLSGNRSVASMPTRSRRIRLLKVETDDTKQPSSRTTVTEGSTDDFDSEEEEDEDYDESINESTMGGVMDNRTPHSSRSMNDFGDQSSITAADIEAALQIHMSRTENLLFDVFPKHVAEALRSGRKVEPENHECVTIFFSDIVGFTNISSELDPMKVSDMLDRLYNSFDALSHYHDVYVLCFWSLLNELQTDSTLNIRVPACCRCSTLTDSRSKRSEMLTWLSPTLPRTNAIIANESPNSP
jgi:Adenylate and Guanylate cyclase catalytic domain